jgi:hypothetical protein
MRHLKQPHRPVFQIKPADETIRFRRSFPSDVSLFQFTRGPSATRSCAACVSSPPHVIHLQPLFSTACRIVPFSKALSCLLCALPTRSCVTTSITPPPLLFIHSGPSVRDGDQLLRFRLRTNWQVQRAHQPISTHHNIKPKTSIKHPNFDSQHRPHPAHARK